MSRNQQNSTIKHPKTKSKRMFSGFFSYSNFGSIPHERVHQLSPRLPLSLFRPTEKQCISSARNCCSTTRSGNFSPLRQHVLKLTQGELDADALFESAVRHLPVVVVVLWVGLALAELAETRGHDDRGHRENMSNQFVLEISKNIFS